MSDKRELIGTYEGKPTIFAFNESLFLMSSSENDKKPIYECTPYNVLWAECSEGSLVIDLLLKKTKAPKLSLVHVVAKVDNAGVEEWVDELMRVAYPGIKPKRHLKVIINPMSGSGKSPSTYTSTIEPILNSARCKADVIYTTHSGHAREIAKSISLDYDALVVVSGDGLIHECFNGFAEHSDAKRAFSIPIAHIPCGTGNAASQSILGLENGLDIATATLNAVKGRVMRIDLCSITQKDKTIYSFLSQSAGLVVDLAVNTERLRWLGSSRLILGYLREVLFLKTCPMSVSVKLVSRDKVKMFQDFKAYRKCSDYEDLDFSPLPPLKFGKEDKDGWIDIDVPFVFFNAGKLPVAAREYLQWPLTRPDDGLIDLVLQEKISRIQLMKAMLGADRGDAYWNPSQICMKVEAYRIKPYGHVNFSSDGENIHLEEAQVEVHRGMAAFLSPYGRYVDEFKSPLSPPVE